MPNDLRIGVYMGIGMEYVKVTRQWVDGGGVRFVCIGNDVEITRVCHTEADRESLAKDIVTTPAGCDRESLRHAKRQLATLSGAFGGEVANQRGTGLLDLARRAEYILRQLPEDELTGWAKIHHDFLRDLRAGIANVGAEVIAG